MTVKDCKGNGENVEVCNQIASQGPLNSPSILKKSNMDILDEALWVRSTEERRWGTPICEPKFKGKVLDLHQKTSCSESFLASDKGWKKRRGRHLPRRRGRGRMAGGARISGGEKHHKITRFCSLHKHLKSLRSSFLNF